MLDNAQLLLPDYTKEERETHKSRWHRLETYVAFLNEHGLRWDNSDPANYERFLLIERRLRPASARVHLASIRGRYDELLDDPDQLRQLIHRYIPQGNTEALVTELENRLRDAVDAMRVPLKTNKAQSRETDKRGLTADQARELLYAPDPDSMAGLRDLALIALMLGTGVREVEIVALQVSDLRHDRDGELALHIPKGVGGRERLIPYGEMRWVLEAVQKWLDRAHIKDGPIFRGFDVDGAMLPTSTAISRRSVQRILQRYPIVDNDGRLEAAKPLDLRRTYAQHLFNAGTDLDVIQQYLGLKTRGAVLDYIVESSRTGRREPPRLYDFDWARLDDIDTENPDNKRRDDMGR